jgi:Fe-S-cluster containining protein
MVQLMTFPCIGCGACCRRVGSIQKFPEDHPLHFPYKNTNGVCENLVDNQCKVYNDRPLVCNVEKLREFLGAEKESFYAENVKYCRIFAKEDGIDYDNHRQIP